MNLQEYKGNLFMIFGWEILPRCDTKIYKPSKVNSYKTQNKVLKFLYNKIEHKQKADDTYERFPTQKGQNVESKKGLVNQGKEKDQEMTGIDKLQKNTNSSTKTKY